MCCGRTDSGKRNGRGTQAAISNRSARTRIIEKLTFEQRLEGGEAVSHVDCWVDKSFRPWTMRPLTPGPGGVKFGLVPPHIHLALEGEDDAEASKIQALLQNNRSGALSS